MKYKVAEKFKSLQGEGVYAGTPMAFIRFVGCSVGKKVCQHCDTDFDEMMIWRGGGEFTLNELLTWAEPYEHICLTGGEPFDQDLDPFFTYIALAQTPVMLHIETSGTTEMERERLTELSELQRLWLCISPKPGWREDNIRIADEVKVIVPGLGEITNSLLMHFERHPQLTPGGASLMELRWPTLEDALRWAKSGKPVFLQPRNAKVEVDKQNLMYVMDLLKDYPQLRLSAQLHKILKVQ